MNAGRTSVFRKDIFLNEKAIRIIEIADFLYLLSRTSFFVHGLPRSHIPLTGQAPKSAEYTEKQLFYLYHYQLPSYP